MALNQATIKTEIISIMNTAFLETDPNNRDQAINNFADNLATTLVNAVKSADITIPTGTIITVGSATTQTQSVPGIVTGGLS